MTWDEPWSPIYAGVVLSTRNSAVLGWCDSPAGGCWKPLGIVGPSGGAPRVAGEIHGSMTRGQELRCRLDP